MTTVKCVFENGVERVTRIRGTINDAREFFLNQEFSMGNKKDDVQKCVEVEELRD